jgi:hypothetical protein
LSIKKYQIWEWSGGKFLDFFPENKVIYPMKMGKTPHPTPHTLHPAPRKNFFSRPLLETSLRDKYNYSLV